ncbi:Asp-tRNA(Asn)/Glu-tRNA(Gln) amidotransferase subunit GatB [Candidatus Curtissbacteria bacterium]|nr:Asp-tRNA(Asn)/Glu-tRNA(Gln) amidotransferase subunit GatB [Candidatus Curtissbacteria bacterium]
MNKYEPVIGLEVHIELSTRSKMFCQCSSDYFGKEPNTHTCPICLGLPGAMPKANSQAIEYTHMLGLALNCQIPLSSKFDRKNYFYPDLAKGFQISQYDLPFSQNGFLEIQIASEHTSGVSKDAARHTPEVGQARTKKIGITRAHLEEDTGKLNHATIDGRGVSLIDFNRSGVPLVEVVSEPEMNSSEEAKAYAQKLQQIVRYLKISDVDMEKGSMRIEPNVSLRKKGEKSLPNYKVELKNINSFRFAQAAIEYEIKRQAEILDSGKIPVQETRGWNEFKNQTVSQRSKEAAHDYRYFPEPDLPPFEFNKNYFVKLKKSIPELPDEKFKRFQDEYKLPPYEIEILTRGQKVANDFEEAVKIGNPLGVTPRQISIVMINKKPDMGPASIIKGIVSSLTIIKVATAEELHEIITEILAKHQKAVEDYKSGKENALSFLIGQVMRKAGSKLDVNSVKSMLQEKLRE